MNAVPGHRHAARGFMLVMTLVLLAIVATAAAAMARRSMLQSTAAIHAEENLQRRWGMRSTMRLLSGGAELMIEHASNLHEQPLRDIAIRTTLNDMDMVILITDEQARPNVNALAEHHQIDDCQQLIARLMREENPSNQPSSVLRLQSLERTELVLAAPDAISRDWPKFFSYSTVFESHDLAAILGLKQASFDVSFSESRENADALGTSITCWGDGRLHWQRATPQAIGVMCEDVIGRHHVETLIRLRREQPGLDSQLAIDQLDLPRKQQDALRQRFTDQSRCHAITVSHRQGSRYHTLMRVEEIRPDKSLVHYSYEQTWP